MKFLVILNAFIVVVSQDHSLIENTIKDLFPDSSERSLVEEVLKDAIKSGAVMEEAIDILGDPQFVEHTKSHPDEAYHKVLKIMLPYKERLGSVWDKALKVVNDIIIHIDTITPDVMSEVIDEAMAMQMENE